MRPVYRILPAVLLILMLTAVVGVLAPQQFEIGAWKLLMLCVAAVSGYIIDRVLFPYARPHTFIHPQLHSAFGTATLRRAIVVSATMVAFALAL